MAPSYKANDKVSVVNSNSGIRMAPSSKYCSAQRYAPATDTPSNTSVAHRHRVRSRSKCEILIPSRCFPLCPRQTTCADCTHMTVPCQQRKQVECSAQVPSDAPRGPRPLGQTHTILEPHQYTA